MTVVVLVVLLFSSFLCYAQRANQDSTVTAKSWNQIHQTINKMNDSTHYRDIVRILGKLYKEFTTSSLDEDALYWIIPEEPDSMYWIMIDTQTKRFKYWSNEKFEKEP